jgi:hypothetical protein
MVESAEKSTKIEEETDRLNSCIYEILKQKAEIEQKGEKEKERNTQLLQKTAEVENVANLSIMCDLLGTTMPGKDILGHKIGGIISLVDEEGQVGAVGFVGAPEATKNSFPEGRASPGDSSCHRSNSGGPEGK